MSSGRHIFRWRFLARNSPFHWKRLIFFVVGIFFAISVNVFYPLPTNSLFKFTSNTEIYVSQDGMVYLVDLNSEKIIWSFKSGPPINVPPKAIDNYGTFVGDNYNASEPIPLFLDYGEDGNLYMQRPNHYKMKILWSVEEFINNAPFITANDGLIIGSKNRSKFFIKDLKTGKAIHSSKFGEHKSENIFDAEENPNMLKDDFKKLLESRRLNFKLKDEPIYVLRKDYEIKYLSQKTQKYLWSLAFSDIEVLLESEKDSLDSVKFKKFVY